MKAQPYLFISLIALLAQAPSLAASDQTTTPKKSKAKIYKYEDSFLTDFKKPLTIGAYKFVPGLAKSYHVRSYQITKNGKVLDSDKCLQTGYDQEYGICLPYATTKRKKRTDLIAADGSSKLDPFNWSETVFGVYVWDGDKPPLPTPARLAPGTDVTGDGIPDLIVGYQPGGHYGYKATIYSLGPTFKKLLTIEGEDNPIFFKDVDGDGTFEILGADSTFNDWHFGYAGAAKPRVIQRIKNNKLVVATDLMKAPPPSKEWLEKEASKIKQEIEDAKAGSNLTDRAASTLAADMLDCIYTGNEGSARKLLLMSFPANMKTTTTEWKSKSDFLNDLKKRLQESKYWPALKEMNEQTEGKPHRKVIDKGC